MRKILALALALMMVFALAACGEDTGKTLTNTDDPGTSQGENNTPPSTSGDTNKSDLTTIGGYLAVFGLTEDDVKCANFTRLEKTAYNLDTLEVKEVGAYASQKLTDEEIRAWLEKMIAKLNSISAEGMIANSHADAEGEPLTADFIMAQSVKGGGGKFTYNGRLAYVVLFADPVAVDNSDPDEAMPSCAITIDWVS